MVRFSITYVRPTRCIGHASNNYKELSYWWQTALRV